MKRGFILGVVLLFILAVGLVVGAGECVGDVPADGKVCRVSAGPCDPAEVCVAGSDDCPVDVNDCPLPEDAANHVCDDPDQVIVRLTSSSGSYASSWDNYASRLPLVSKWTESRYTGGCYYQAGTSGVIYNPILAEEDETGVQGPVANPTPTNRPDCGTFNYYDFSQFPADVFTTPLISKNAAPIEGDACLYECPENYGLFNAYSQGAYAHYGDDWTKTPNACNNFVYRCKYIGQGGASSSVEGLYQPNDHTCKYSCPAGSAVRKFISEIPTGSSDCNQATCQEITVGNYEICYDDVFDDDYVPGPGDDPHECVDLNGDEVSDNGLIFIGAGGGGSLSSPVPTANVPVEICYGDLECRTADTSAGEDCTADEKVVLRLTPVGQGWHTTSAPTDTAAPIKVCCSSPSAGGGDGDVSDTLSINITKPANDLMIFLKGEQIIFEQDSAGPVSGVGVKWNFGDGFDEKIFASSQKCQVDGNCNWNHIYTGQGVYIVTATASAGSVSAVDRIRVVTFQDGINYVPIITSPPFLESGAYVFPRSTGSFDGSDSYVANCTLHSKNPTCVFPANMPANEELMSTDCYNVSGDVGGQSVTLHCFNYPTDWIDDGRWKFSFNWNFYYGSNRQYFGNTTGTWNGAEPDGGQFVKFEQTFTGDANIEREVTLRIKFDWL